MNMIHKLQRKIMNLTGRAILTALQQKGGKVTLQLKINETDVRDGVELAEQYGVASFPFNDIEMTYQQVGGDSSHLVAFTLSDHRYRIELAKGEVALYTDEGDKIHLKRGNKIVVETNTLELCGNSDALALASKVDAEFVKIAAALTAVSNGGGAVTGVNSYTTPIPVGSSKVKAT